MTTKESNNISIGNSGEYFVAAELERRGFTAAIPMSNTKDFDILAISRTKHSTIAIQVKTTQYKHKRWMLNKKCETLFAPHIKYVLVALNELSEKVGVANVNLSKLKNGKVSAIRFSTLEAICNVLDCQPGDILEFKK